MGKTLKQELASHKLLLTFSSISLLFLITFLVFQHNEMKLLSLEVKWLAFSSVPILIALFVGGYIKNFKGFGLELESNLKEPIPSFLITVSEFKKSEGMNKESLNRLYQLGDKEKNKIDRLKFIYGKSDYYDSYVVTQYFKHLPKLKFVEIVNDNEEFLYLIPISSFKSNSGFNEGKIENFIQNTETENIRENFPDLVSDYILMNEKIIEAYRKFKKSTQTRIIANNKDILPILSNEKKMIGTIDKQRLEAKIAEEVDESID